MLTFFRRIRKGLLDTGAARKYLLYAVGEVLLVMIGILLALQVNNWNEDRKKSNLGELYTIQIYQDLQNDLNSLDFTVSTLKVQYDAAMLVLEILETGKLPHSDTIKFLRDLIVCANAIIPQRLPNTWDELKSTGQLAIIHNDSLSNLIQSFYAYYDSRISNFNRIQESLREDFRILTSSSFTMDDFRKSVTNDYHLINQSAGIGIKGDSSTIQRIIKESSSTQLVSSIATGTIWNIQFFTNLSSQAQSIISYMEENYPDILNQE